MKKIFNQEEARLTLLAIGDLQAKVDKVIRRANVACAEDVEILKAAAIDYGQLKEMRNAVQVNIPMRVGFMNDFKIIKSRYYND